MKLFRYFICRYERSGWLYYSRFIHVYYIYTADTNVCAYTYTRARARTHIHTYALVFSYMRLEFFYKYYKETVIHVHDMYRRVSKEGLITQAPFLRLLSMWKSKERARENKGEYESVNVYVRKEEKRGYRGLTQCFFWILQSAPLITFHLCLAMFTLFAFVFWS